jgi:hypothetical protein
MSTEVTTSNPTGNARLTGLTGAVLFVLLAAEGYTILGVQSHLTAHIFIGMLLVPIATLKIISTAYRFARYYTGEEHYVAKGAPPAVLRVVGPFVVVLTVAVLATGVALGFAGRGHHTLLQLHKASFILWFGATTIHVLGHALETPRLAIADWAQSSQQAAGRVSRVILVVAALILGLALAFATRNWAHAWHDFRFG